MCKHAGLRVIALALCAVFASSLAVCQGEGPRYGDFKCNHDSTHRVCAHLVDNSGGQCKELSWGKGTFWEITHQQAWNWKESVCNAVSAPRAVPP